MGADSTIRTSFVLSCGVHAVIFSIFSFVIILDLGSATPSMEVTYVGSSKGRESTRSDVFSKILIEKSPSINLPDRTFATESVVSDAEEEVTLVPAVDGKVDLRRVYTRSRSDSGVLSIARPPVGIGQSVSLDVGEKYAVEGELASRKIILRPPSPEYPQWAVKGGLEANMKLRITVNPHGIVEKVESVQTTGYPKMDLVASRYIKQWRFESRILDTESETGVISVKFRLK